MHERVPGLAEPDLRTYLEILGHATECWEDGEQHVLEAVFAAADRPALARCSGADPPG